MKRNQKRNIGESPLNTSRTLGYRTSGQDAYGRFFYVAQPTVVRSLRSVGGDRPSKRMTRKKARMARR